MLRATLLMLWVMSGVWARAAEPQAPGTEPVRTACKEVTRCASSCEGVDAAEDDPPHAVTATFRGAFSAPGAEEAIVSLFPCGESFSRRHHGTTVLLAKRGGAWTSIATSQTAVSKDECHAVVVEGRTVLFCKSGVGPNQGILTDAVCTLSGRGGELEELCPFRVIDARGAGCFTDPDGEGRKTWAAGIRSFEIVTIGGRAGVRVEVEEATASMPAGEGLDDACDAAVQKLETAPRNVRTLELVFDGRRLTLTPGSRKAVDTTPWIFENDPEPAP